MPFPLFPTLAILSVLALPLESCGLSPGRLSVDLGPALRECQKLSPKVDVRYIEDESDYRDIAPEALAALKKANQGASARTRCENRLIAKYAAAK